MEDPSKNLAWQCPRRAHEAQLPLTFRAPLTGPHAQKGAVPNPFHLIHADAGCQACGSTGIPKIPAQPLVIFERHNNPCRIAQPAEETFFSYSSGQEWPTEVAAEADVPALGRLNWVYRPLQILTYELPSRPLAGRPARTSSGPCRLSPPPA
jgi:hypothetical protein